LASASFRSVAEVFLHRVASTPDSDAFVHFQDGAWQRMTWQRAGDRAKAIGCGLMELGIEPEQRCAILSATRVEWILADMGIMTAGAATTTLYTDNTPDECAHVLQDSQAQIIFTEHAEHSATIVALRSRLPQLRCIVQVIPGGEASHQLMGDAGRHFVITLAALEEAGLAWDREHPGVWLDRARSVEPQHLAAIIYTSGTTGRPKGVELTHDCWVFEGESMDALGIMSPADTQYLFLPLAHSFAKVMEIASIRIGVVTVVDGRSEDLVAHLSQTRPSFMAAVPRIFEKLHNAIVHQAHASGPVGRHLFRWAIRVGTDLSDIRQAGQRPSTSLLLRHHLAKRLVFSRITDQFGGRLRFFVSGGAPLPRDLARFFHAAGILVLEGYGLTESSAASFVNRPERYRFGTVGPAMPGVQIRLDPADGEILLKGRGVMRGYHGLPEDTAAVLDADGWLRTGDIGTVDAEGFLTITDRKKDLIKTSGGKYVAPRAIEAQLAAASPWISRVLVHGNGRNFVSALLTLDQEHARGWARQAGLGDLDVATLSRNSEIYSLIQEIIDRVNSMLPSHQQIRRFALLPHELSVERGELTPTLKVKRSIVEQHYKSLLDGFYADAVVQI